MAVMNLEENELFKEAWYEIGRMYDQLREMEEWL